MNSTIDVGFPDLDDAIIDELAERCEQVVAESILEAIPPKSIETLSVSCILEYERELHLAIEVDIEQKYDTGHDLEAVIQKASENGSKWLETYLREM